MTPVLINEIFAINEEFQIEKVEDVIIIDNLFKDWKKIRDVFIDTPAFNWKKPPGSNNFVNYYDCRHYCIRADDDKFPFTNAISKIIESSYNVKVVDDKVIRTNWFKQINNKTSDWSEIHTDGKDFTFITFLNNKYECSGGTTLFKNIPCTEGNRCMDYWSHLKNVGTPTNIEMKPGKTIIFPSKIPHAAWHPIDSFYDFPRLNMVARFERI
jgi:hypothetical protein